MKNRDLNGLLTFQVVVREGSFSAAGRHLGVTPGAVSRSIGQLERAMDVRLFNRTTVEFGLTSEGRRLASLVCNKLEALEDAFAHFNAENKEPQGLIKVSLTNSYGKHYVIPRLHKFMEKFPKITLEIALNDHRQFIIDGGYDVGICYGSPEDPAYVSRVVCQPKLILVGSPDYLKRRGLPLEPHELAQHDCINVSIEGKGSGEWVFQHEAPERAEPIQIVQPNGKIIFSDQIDGVLHGAVAGLGLTVIHARAALPYLKDGRLKAILTDYKINAKLDTSRINVFFPHRAWIAQRVRAFVDFLIDDDGDDAVDYKKYQARNL